jgi:hypothetical protein
MLAKAQGGDVWYADSDSGARFVVKLRKAEMAGSGLEGDPEPS